MFWISTINFTNPWRPAKRGTLGETPAPAALPARLCPCFGRRPIYPDVQVLPDQLRVEPVRRSRHRDGSEDGRDRGDVRAAEGGGEATRCRGHARIPGDLVQDGRQALRAGGGR